MKNPGSISLDQSQIQVKYNSAARRCYKKQFLRKAAADSDKKSSTPPPGPLKNHKGEGQVGTQKRPRPEQNTPSPSDARKRYSKLLIKGRTLR
ncbi:glutamic acid-rich [Lasius niger]|uniref:Glutamic acid-rich n=1 Tax=Lasius niger TaxID=67767 RepID=A0A0J7K7U2_LASNI|nr:glutamic acid-rich [Lasius niger]